MTQLSPRLTVSEPDAYPCRFAGPFGTVAFVIDEFLNIFVQSDAHPADWDLARGLMDRIADPARRIAKAPSTLRNVDEWQVRLVDRSAFQTVLAAR